VRGAAIAALARREHSRTELKRKLTARGFDAGQVDSTLEALAAERLQDDGRYLESYVNSRASRGYGPVRIRAELAQRGIDGKTAVTVLDDPDRDWFELATTARTKKFGRGAPATIQDRAKQTRYLEYRGFTSEQIREALGRGGGED
jgi:regulatory protein